MVEVRWAGFLGGGGGGFLDMLGDTVTKDVD